MINEISLENFKSWKKIEKMRFAPITGLFGTNSSGKTSILQWLLLQKQTVESSDRGLLIDLGDDNSLVEFGSINDVVHRNALTRADQFGWSISWKMIDPTLARPLDSSPYSFTTTLKADKSPELLSFRYRSNQLNATWDRVGQNHTKLNVSDGDKQLLDADMEGDYDFRETAKYYGFPDGYRSGPLIGDVLSNFERQYERLFSSIRYLGPLRDYPKRIYQSGRARPSDVGPRGQKVVDALIASRLDTERRIDLGDNRRWLEVETARWLRELRLVENFRLSFSGPNDEFVQVLLQKTSTSSEVSITDLGFGISQILPVIVLCYYVPKGSIIIFEQPEIHLHPSAQAGLADVFIDAMQTRGIQIILESHSEHLMRRLQRRIAEEKISKDDVALYFCEYEKDQSHLKELDIDPYGNIKNWPKNFFGDLMEEVSEMTIAAMERLIRQEEAGH